MLLPVPSGSNTMITNGACIRVFVVMQQPHGGGSNVVGNAMSARSQSTEAMSGPAAVQPLRRRHRPPQQSPHNRPPPTNSQGCCFRTTNNLCGEKVGTERIFCFVF